MGALRITATSSSPRSSSAPAIEPGQQASSVALPGPGKAGRQAIEHWLPWPQGASLRCCPTAGKFLEKLGICHELALIRRAFDGVSPSPDSNLLIKNLIFDNVPVRVYWPKTPVTGQRRGVLYFHGGAGLFGSIRGFERICYNIAQRSDSVVVCVGFRLAPEHPYPIQVRDCLTAAIHFLKHAEEYGVDSNHIVIFGDSSGGTYAAAVAQELVTRVDLPRLRAQILIYPFLQALDFNLPSYQQNHSCPVVSKKVALQFGFRILGKKVTGMDAIMKNAHVSEAMRVKYCKWISADLIPAEFKLRSFEPPVLAPFSEELHEMMKPVFETRFSPLLAEDAVIRQLPETFLLTCKYDIFRDDGLLYKKRLEDNGVPVTWYHSQEGVHGLFLLLGYPYLEDQSLRDYFKHIIHFLKTWAIWYDFSKSEIPPGVDQPLKLRFLHWLMIISSFLGKILENLSLCSEIHFVRYTQEGKKLGEDPKLIIQDLTFENIPVRLYQPRESEAQQKRRGVVFFHGGGWMFGSLNSYDHVCRHIAKESDSVLLSVGYSLAPEQKYPSQFEECLGASAHFMKNAESFGVDPARVIVSGDSVGGNFAASVCQALVSRSDLPPPLAQILIYPGLQAIDFNLPSYQQNRAVPILYREHVVGAALQYLNKDLSVLESVVQGCHVPIDIKQRFGKWINSEVIPSEFKVRGYKPHLTTSFLEDVYEVVKQALETTFSPLMAEEAVLCRLPKTCIVTCEYDVLRDDGILYKQRLEDSGVPVTWYHIENGFHGVINLFDGFLSFPSGKKGMDRIVTFLRGL
ncbi:hypothetical protein lerEdw1_003187 [Lerista edwardsae]|nr:hypothetical protein lerEdw1_003187 [Lerista edwardsae]